MRPQQVNAHIGIKSGNKQNKIFSVLSQAHAAIAECEKRLKAQGRRVVVITQNIDELHKRAGSENILELHGKAFAIFFSLRCPLSSSASF